MIRPSDLVGPYEIGEMLVDDRTALPGLLTSREFPAPVVCTGEGRDHRLWLIGDVVRWAEEYDRTVRLESRPDDPSGGVMTATEIAELLGWSSPSTAWDLVKKGKFPAPVDQHGRTKLWSRSDVEEWERTATRRPRQRPASV